jgi:hypothetical protein
MVLPEMNAETGEHHHMIGVIQSALQMRKMFLFCFIPIFIALSNQFVWLGKVTFEFFMKDFTYDRLSPLMNEVRLENLPVYSAPKHAVSTSFLRKNRVKFIFRKELFL